ncbi:relaxase/mobilization nuclease domain-containing protein [Sphingomonas sp. LB-2]|uniref:relaxase/mobilization nuclease domain-containing protein n=1 Tax=Sphingomonas caeni TaxID=2984949 RepID=UPI0022313108|nr:relaxase/mobilization nuclease domain-containing protein [Sphingomonas caeni]MCW3847378.1 relaxase/mobilization nuclease domain-containing protein [Sphingomonas caeni]
MILKGSQRAGSAQLAAHLLSRRDNEHVCVHELRGFAADDLHGALAESYAISRGTKCTQFMFSLSLNPPKGAVVGEEEFERAADEAEKRLGLEGQPRAMVFHEKEGRRHAHVVWSRIDAEAMRAINLPHFKRRLTDLSRELYLEHGWMLPDGLRTNGGKSPLNFTLEEWQRAKRNGVDPREIKDAIRDAWARSDSAKALSAALEERGYFLAQGDRRGFVAIDTNGDVYPISRWAGIKAKEVAAKLGAPDALRSVADVKRDLALRMTEQLRDFHGALRERHARELEAPREELRRIVLVQRAERDNLDAAQKERRERETRDRAARFRKGLAGLWDAITGRRRELTRANEAETIDAMKRDRAERDALVRAHLEQRRASQMRIGSMRARHAQDRRVMTREAVAALRRLRPPKTRDAETRARGHAPQLTP